ncbi:MAG TPA: hypothetical protein VES42_16030 [Pilimelia sp.]|nr:hypothetical protein [Pilimelia sp.]
MEPGTTATETARTDAASLAAAEPGEQAAAERAAAERADSTAPTEISPGAVGAPPGGSAGVVDGDPATPGTPGGRRDSTLVEPVPVRDDPAEADARPTDEAAEGVEAEAPATKDEPVAEDSALVGSAGFGSGAVGQAEAATSRPPHTAQPGAAEALRSGDRGRATGSAAVPVPTERPDRQRTRLLAAAAVVAVLAVLAVIVLVSNLADDQGRGPGVAASEPPVRPATAEPARPGTSAEPTDGGPTTTAPVTTGPPSPSAAATGSQPLVLPAGLHSFRDRTGFSVAVPRSWRVERRGTMVYFRERGGQSRVLGIDQSDRPKSDPVADWTDQERTRRADGDWRDYRRVRIVNVPDYHLAAADWEFTYAGSNARLHVVNRGFVTARDQAHAIFWLTPDSRWAENLDEFSLITRSFRPVPSRLRT